MHFHPNVRNYLFFTIVVFFLLDNLLKNIFSFNYGYVIGIGVLTLISLSSFISMKKHKNFFVLLFAVLIASLQSVFFYLNYNFLPDGFFETYYLLVLSPFFIFLAISTYNNKDLYHLLSLLSNTFYISLFGSLLYYFYILGFINYDLSYFLSPEKTRSFGEIVIRNNSIYGGSLAAGGILFMQLLLSVFLYDKTDNSKYVLWVYILFFLILTTMSRRVIIPATLLLTYMVFFRYRKFNLKHSVFIFIALILFSYFYIDYLEVLILRYLGAFDFFGHDVSNLSRLNAIQHGFISGIYNPFGTGLGSASSIGKEVNSIHDSIGFIGVAESFYMTIFAELGVFFSFIFIILLLKFTQSLDRTTKLIFLFPLLLESVMGLSLLNPASNLFFYISLFSSFYIFRNEEYYASKKSAP